MMAAFWSSRISPPILLLYLFALGVNSSNRTSLLSLIVCRAYVQHLVSSSSLKWRCKLASHSLIEQREMRVGG
jgi:hypothetical protein